MEEIKEERKEREEMGARARKEDEILEKAEEAISTLAAELLGRQGMDVVEGIRWTTGRLLSKALEGELTHHLGYKQGGVPPVGQANRRNGKTSKTVRTSFGPVKVEVPRDRDGSFEPKIVGKHQRNLREFEEKILSLYGRGMSTRDIQRTLREIYGTEVSAQFISDVTDSIVEELEQWQQRPLDSVYFVLYIDAMFARTREKGPVSKRAVYTVVGMGADGYKDVLGMYVADTESSKFWMAILEDLRRRGVERIGVVAADGLSGLPEAIEAVFPQAVFQTCVVHLIRGSLKLVPWKDRKALTADLRKVYTAASEEKARVELTAFKAKWDRKYPMVAKAWEERWADWTPFLDLPEEARKIIYTTNTVEAFHRRLRKVIKTKGSFPNDLALLKTLFLAMRDAKHHWGRPTRSWAQARLQLAIQFDLLDALEA